VVDSFSGIAKKMVEANVKEDSGVKDSTGYQYGSGYGVDAVLDVKNVDYPFCSHGPTLLFERFFKEKEPRRFFACSASRDRKECSFFQWEDDKVTAGKILLQEETKKKLFKKKKAVVQLQEGDNWCFDCSSGYPSENTAHQGHATKMLTGDDVKLPTQFLIPSESKKAKAQYFFNDDTCQFFLTTIKRMQYKNILCIGTPRLFELLRNTTDASVILLDIDTRFENFFSSEEFLHYNIYTHFFFDKGRREKTLQSFISKCTPEDTLLILDPPFGGLLNVLEKTLSKIYGLLGAESVPTMMVFPYFLESHVSRSLPLLLMHDYKVSYSNHPTYHNNGKQVRGSPVRLYTNIPGDKLSMPKEEYKFCKVCQRYVYKENWHCAKCKACTSKDGRRYTHCDECEKCVKPGDVHCATCNVCKPVKHACATSDPSPIGCHICGEFEHKRRDCPKKVENMQADFEAGKKRRRSVRKSKVGGDEVASKKKNTGKR